MRTIRLKKAPNGELIEDVEVETVVVLNPDGTSDRYGNINDALDACYAKGWMPAMRDDGNEQCVRLEKQ